MTEPPDAAFTEAAEPSWAVGTRLLRTDARVAAMLANEWRYRLIERTFGASREQANVITAVGALVLAESLHGHAQRMMQGPAFPPPGDIGLGLVAGREVIYGVAGESSRDMPLLGSIVTVAVFGGFLAPVLRDAQRSSRAAFSAGRARFNVRYGHLIRTRVRRRAAERHGAP